MGSYFTKAIIREGMVPEQYIEKVSNRADYNLSSFYSLLRMTNMEGIENLISAIHKSTFTTAHSKSHHHYTTGTLEHSLGVYHQMLELSDHMGLEDRDIMLASLLHDVGMGYSKEWSAYSGHGDRGKSIVQRYLKGVSPEVLLAIKMHRHKASEDGKLKKEDHPLWDILYKADHADAATCNRATEFFEKL